MKLRVFTKLWLTKRFILVSIVCLLVLNATNIIKIKRVIHMYKIHHMVDDLSSIYQTTLKSNNNDPTKVEVCSSFSVQVNYTKSSFAKEFYRGKKIKTLPFVASFNLQPWNPENTMLFGRCGQESARVRWNMLFLIKSAVDNLKRREIIRSTWGSVKMFDGVLLESIFLVGLSNSESTQSSIESEHSRYGDILQFSGKDSFKFLPYKVLAGMQWASGVLPKNWLYSSVDDDILVNPSSVVDYFHKLLTNYTTETNDICFDNIPMVCVYSFQPKDLTSRKRHTKWYVSRKQYRKKYWPAHCRGGMYVTNKMMLFQLLNVSKTNPIINGMDDAWITGLMRRRLLKHDTNIIAAPMALMTDKELVFKELNISSLLVKHFWGNTKTRAIDVPKEMLKEWNKLEPMINNKIECKDDKT